MKMVIFQEIIIRFGSQNPAKGDQEIKRALIKKFIANWIDFVFSGNFFLHPPTLPVPVKV